MSGLHDVLRHLVLYGPARNDDEREQLLNAIDADEHPQQAEPQPAPATPQWQGDQA